jgi:hypothetical protein
MSPARIEGSVSIMSTFILSSILLHPLMISGISHLCASSERNERVVKFLSNPASIP